MRYTFPTLYKADSNGGTRQWIIVSNHVPGWYYVEHGLVGGKMQSTEVECSPKNVGRANATTAIEQADLEARSKWSKQQDKGYSQSLGENFLADKKSMLPMLAHSYETHKHKLVYPCYAQPKLDGIRCVADGKGNLLSRKGKEFYNLFHIQRAVVDAIKFLNMPTLILDGELYSHSIPFQTITSIARRKNTIHPRTTEIQYHIYDCFDNAQHWTNKERQAIVQKLVGVASLPIVIVETKLLNNDVEVLTALREREQAGYEGLILRNVGGYYKHDRSSDLQKVKSFIDEEFEIVGGVPGVGKFAEFCTFQCKTNDGKIFGVMPMGSDEERREYLINLDNYIGKHLTVRFFEWTEDWVPRFPVGVAIRNYE